ncbi:hypothetical protein GCM10023189_37900 [Nibrella saemangeumensis]|uniref:Uncharacterized protein n=1 Tax=Nibrella saemangeumensis TaxID=1084526 RepID=A0ABP8N609_9BACT
MDQNEEFTERFRKLFDALHINANEAAQKTGESNTKFYNLLNGKGKPSFATVVQLCETYPNINTNYLVKGQLPILFKSSAEMAAGPLNSVGRVIRLPFYSSGENQEEPGVHDLPVTADSQSHYIDSVIIRLADNTMAPCLTAGMLLRARPVPETEWDYLNSVVVGVLYRSTLVVRRVKENDLLTRGYLTLYTDSADAGYVPVKREDIRSIWRVLEIVSGVVA